VQHNCAAHDCDTSGTRIVIQERQQTDQVASAVVHRTPSDLVLNTAKMRDARIIQAFGNTLTPMDSDLVISAACRSYLEEN
jgi:hypothetical protein